MQTVQSAVDLTNAVLKQRRQAALTTGEFFRWLAIRGVLSVIRSAVTVVATRSEGGKYQFKTIDASLNNVKLAGDAAVDGLDRIVQAVYAAPYTYGTKQKVVDAKNWWNLMKTNFPTKIDIVLTQCRAIIGFSESTLTDLGQMRFIDKSSKEDKLAVAHAVTNAMLVIVVTRQICAGRPTPGPAHARRDIALVALFLKHVGDELGDRKTSQNAQAYIDYVNSPNAPSTSNEQLVDPISKFLNDGTTLFDGLNATFNSNEFCRAINTDRNTASGYSALSVMIAFADCNEVKSPKTLNSTTASSFNERVSEYFKIDKNVDFWHNAKVQQIDGMRSAFGEQHGKRMSALNRVNTKVRAITTQAAQSFSRI